MGKIIDLVGKEFGRLTVIERTGERTNRGIELWKCQCECGNIKYVNKGNLESGGVRSCGCLLFDSGHKMWLDNDIVNTGRFKGTRMAQLGQKVSSRNTSGTKGVYRRKDTNKWNASIHLSGKRYALGCYEKLEDAIKARKLAEEELFHPIIEEYNNQLQEVKPCN